MRIQRDSLNEAFSNFGRTANGVVIGAPGIGKSHLLREHFKAQLAAGRPACLIALDTHVVHDDDELRRSLGLEDDLVTTLNSEEKAQSPAPGLLLIDSYDALRSEQSQRFILRLIRRAKNVLRDRWRIVVAVRTFDASRSAELLDLFPAEDRVPSQFQLRGVHCSHFWIPPLSDAETEQAVQTVEHLRPLYEAGSPEFCGLLHTPFHIWLAEKLLQSGTDAQVLSSVSSEVQLLSMFWRQRVDSGALSLSKQVLLATIAKAMVSEKLLSTRLDALYRNEDDSTWRELFSTEVLTRADTASQRVAFAHNILFDFAVSVLLIEDEPSRAAAFLSEDPARPVFLRPSLDYFFTRLWFENRTVFWSVAWFLLTSSDGNLRLFGRLIPMGVVVREARLDVDLRPFLEALDRNGRGAPDAVVRLLQALRSLGPKSLELWIRFFQELSTRLDRPFAWDLAVQAFEFATNRRASASVIEGAGHVGRDVLRWIWSVRGTQQWADALGSSWAMRLAVQTYCTDPRAASELLRPVLDAIDDPKFPIEYLRRLVSGVDNVWPCDPDFAVEIYARTFGHREESREATNMGSPILRLTSNKRQDFDMSLYELQHHFAAFLKADLPNAFRAGVSAIDAYVNREYVAPRAGHGEMESAEPKMRQFAFRGRDVTIAHDGSEIWDSTGYRKHNLKIADEMFGATERLAELGDVAAVESVVDAFIERARVAFLWSHLFQIASRHPDLFAERIFGLVVNDVALTEPDTVTDAITFIVAAYPHWEEDQRRQFEQLSVRLTGDQDSERQDRRRHRFLGVLPPALVVTEEAKAVQSAAQAKGETIRNERRARFSVRTRTLSEDDFIREQGVDPEAPQNQPARALSATLRGFEDAWRNALPPKDKVDAILASLEAGARSVIEDTQADESVTSELRTRVAATAKLCARTLRPADVGFSLVRQILLESIRRPGTVDLPDADEDIQRASASWSPRPETEAAQGLPWVAMRQPDEEVLHEIGVACSNPEAIIRYLAVRELFRLHDVAPGRMWALIDERIECERAPVTNLAICESLARLAHRERSRVSEAASRLWAKLPTNQESGSDFRDVLLDIVIWLAVDARDDWAQRAVEQLVREPLTNPEALEILVFGVLHKVIPSRRTKATESYNAALALASLAVTSAAAVLKSRNTDHDAREADIVKSLYGVLDETVAHVYFCLSPETSRDGGASSEERRMFFEDVTPVLNLVLDFGLGDGYLDASTVHHFMQLLNDALVFDAKRCVMMAARAAQAGTRSNYNIDSLAIKEVVKLVERLLADHRQELQEGEALDALTSLLDVFATTGWPEAIQLVWRLDDLFR